jgi:hypothetical protein
MVINATIRNSWPNGNQITEGKKKALHLAGISSQLLSVFHAEDALFRATKKRGNLNGCLACCSKRARRDSNSQPSDP